MFSMSTSKSSSEATDNRSQASGYRTLAAGGNKGALSYYNPGSLTIEAQGNSNIWKVLAVVFIAFVAFKTTPAFRRTVSKILGKK